MIQISNYTVNEFEEQVKEKKIICFCAGNKFMELCARYRLGQKLLYVVDNYVDKNVIKAGNIEVPVRRMDEMGDEVRESMLLLTSIKYASEIISQLDAISLCDNLTFYVPELFGTEADDIVPAEGGTRKIPKRIHYCWFGGGRIPERYCRNLETWERYCSDYEIVRWDESNYDISKSLYMKQAYEAGKWGFVSDYARIDVVNRYGGIYLDTDVEILRSLDGLLQYNLFCGFESSGYVNFGLGFGATKNSRILRDILAEYEGAEFKQGGGERKPVTCPVYQTKVLERYGLVRNGRTQIKEYFTALSPEYLSPLNQYGIGRVTLRSFAIHQYAATWIDGQQRSEKDKKAECYRYVIDRMKQGDGQGCMKLPWGYAYG